MFATLAPFLALAFPILVLIGAGKDVLSYTIPNWVSLALVAFFPAAWAASGASLEVLGTCLAVGAAVLVAGVVMFALRWIGGGDAKLFAAAALWIGWAALPSFALGVALTGGTLALMLLSLRSAALRPLVLLGPPWVVKLAEPGEGVPYGVAIAVGALTAFPASPLSATLPLSSLGL